MAYASVLLIVVNLVTVSVRSRPHNETQGVQETFPCSDAREKLVFVVRPQKLTLTRLV